jgi:hypothetical protein
LGLSLAATGAIGVLAGQAIAYKNAIKRDAFARGYPTFTREQARRLD